MKDKKQLIVYAALAITALLTLLPFFKVGFTTGDDFQYFITARHPANWINDAIAYAEGAGRFYFLITKYFYYIPYLIDNFGFTKAVQYISLLASYAMFSWLVYRLFKSENLSLLTMLLLIFDTVITANNHVPVIAYPFYFSFSLIIFIGAILLYMNYKEKSGYWRLIVSAGLFGVAYLFYETYLVFALIFGIVTVALQLKTKSFGSMLCDRDSWLEIIPFISSAIIYIGCYWGYRQWLVNINPEKIFYDGASFSIGAFSISGFFKVLWRCTRFAFPGQSFFDSQSLLSDNSLQIGGHHKFIFNNISAIVWVNALLQTILLWHLTREKESFSIDKKKIGFGIVISLVVAFLSHTLIGIAKKYNTEWCNWMHGYVTSFFSIFALMLALALAIVVTLSVKNNTIRKAARIMLCLAILFLSLLTGYTNEHLSREWAKTQNRLKLIDMIAKTDFFSTLPEDAMIYDDELHNTSWVTTDISQGQELEYYINLRAGRNFKYVAKNDMLQVPASTPLYYIHASESKKNCEILISISKLDSTRNNCPDSLFAIQSDIFYYSPTKRYTVFYKSKDHWKHISYWDERQKERLTHVLVNDTAINPRMIVISDMTIPMSQN